MFRNECSAADGHPRQAGLFRRKHPSERRHGLPPVTLWAFYSDHIARTIANNLKLVGTIVWILGLKRRIERDPLAALISTLLLTPVVDDDAALDLLTKTSGAKAAIAHHQKSSGADALGCGPAMPGSHRWRGLQSPAD